MKETESGYRVGSNAAGNHAVPKTAVPKREDFLTEIGTALCGVDVPILGMAWHDRPGRQDCKACMTLMYGNPPATPRE